MRQIMDIYLLAQTLFAHPWQAFNRASSHGKKLN